MAQMDRRKFLKMLGIGGATAAVAPTVLLDALTPQTPIEKIAAALDVPVDIGGPLGFNHWSYGRPFADGGELDIGVVRDSTLNRRNQFTVFSESFEGLTYLPTGDRRIGFPASS